MHAPTNRHSGFLDVLRAIAIVLVLLRHGISVPSGASVGGTPVQGFAATVATNGWLGVDLFFVLSGYLLCSQIIDARERGTWNARNFYLRRAIRILPPYLTVMLFCWAGGLAWLLGRTGVLDPFVLLNHLTFMQDYSGSPLLVTLWSLATEEKFYLAIPLAAAALMRLRAGRVALLLLGLSLLVAASRTVAVYLDAPTSYPAFFWGFRAPFHFAIDGLLIGIAVAFAETNLRPRSHIGRALAFGCGCAALVAAAWLASARDWLASGDFASTSVATWCFAACCGLIILTVRVLGLESQVPDVPRAVTRLATLSYSLYLVHYPMAVLAHRLFPQGSGLEFWTVYSCLSLLLAYFLNATTELPFRILRQRLRGDRPANAEPQVETSSPTVHA